MYIIPAPHDIDAESVIAILGRCTYDADAGWQGATWPDEGDSVSDVNLHNDSACRLHRTRRTVLVVEDEGPIAEALALVIEDAGYIPLLAINGREGLALARIHHPDLVITDLMMPYMDGATLIDRLRVDAWEEHTKPPPIVLMTAAGLGRAHSAHADLVLNKPFDLDEIDALLAQYLSRN